MKAQADNLAVGAQVVEGKIEYVFPLPPSLFLSRWVGLLVVVAFDRWGPGPPKLINDKIGADSVSQTDKTRNCFDVTHTRDSGCVEPVPRAFA